jgi:hypothetical protein
VGCAIAVQGGILSNQNGGKAAATLIGLTAAGTAAGYLLGNAADRKSVVWEIAP